MLPEVFHVDEGPVTLRVPATLSPESYQDVADRIEILLRVLKRRSAATQNASAKVPFMITKQQKPLLRELGHDDDAISKMTPEQAHKVVGVLG